MANATVVAKGILTQYQGVNYLLMREFQIVTNKQSTAGTKKADASPVTSLVEEGVAARYEKKDIAAAEKAWEKAIPLLDQTGVTAMDRYQVYAGLGLIYGERGDYTKSRDYFKKAVAASEKIADNRKPLSYSYYNLACAEALLGESEAALASLRLALEAERQTERRVYTKRAVGDDSFAKLKDDQRFAALLKEFAGSAAEPKR